MSSMAGASLQLEHSSFAGIPQFAHVLERRAILKIRVVELILSSLLLLGEELNENKRLRGGVMGTGTRVLQHKIEGEKCGSVFQK